MAGEHYIGTHKDDLWLTDDEDDILEGLGGKDELYAGEGDDVIDGGAGDDILWGEGGNDIYVYRLGDGNDIIHENSGLDTIRFDASVDFSKVKIARVVNHLELTIQIAFDTNHKLTVANWFVDTASKVEKVEFTDGKGSVILTWDTSILEMLAQGQDERKSNESVNPCPSTLDQL